MSGCCGVVIQPSACRAIHAKVLWPRAGTDHQRHVAAPASARPSSGRTTRTRRRRPPPPASTASASPRRTPGARCGAGRRGRRGRPSSSVFQPKPAPIVDPTAGEVVEGGDLLGQGDRVGLDRQRHRGREPDPAGHRRRGGQRDPRVEGAGVAVVGQRLVTGARVRRVAAYGDVGVLGHVEGVEATLLRRARQGGRGDPAVGGEQDETVAHAPHTRTCCSSGVAGVSSAGR